MHYVVVQKITKEQIIIADPAKGIVKLSPEAFFGKIHEEDVLVKQNCNTSV